MAAQTAIIRFNEQRELFELGLSNLYEDELPLQKTSYGEWLKEETARRWFDTDMRQSGLGVMPQKDIGAEIKRDRVYWTAKKTYEMTAYALALVVQYEVLRWEMYDSVKDATKSLARSAKTRYDLVAYALLNNAFSTSSSVYTTHAGEAFCAVAHTRPDGGTWKNRPTTDSGLSMTMLQTAAIDIKKTVNDRGLYADITPKTLIVAVEGRWLANTLVKSSYNPENANLTYNNAAAMSLKVVDSVYITTSTYWFLQADKSIPKVKMSLGDDANLRTAYEPATMNTIFTSYCSFRLDVFDSYGWYGSTGV